jgi:hypothetical protein
MNSDIQPGISDRRSASDPQVDRWAGLSFVADVLPERERAFGTAGEGRLLDRYALEALIHLISAPRGSGA